MICSALLSLALLDQPFGSWRDKVAHHFHFKPVPPITARAKPIRVARRPPQQRTGLTISHDPSMYVLDEKGQLVRVESDDRVDSQALRALLGPMNRALKSGDSLTAEREFTRIPALARNMELDANTLGSLRDSYYRAGVFIADMQGDYRKAAERAYYQLRQSYSPQAEVVFAAASYRLGDRSPELMAYLSESKSKLFPALTSVTANGGRLTEQAVVELIAAQNFAYGASEVLGIAHAERALALAPKQAYSAIILVPAYSRQGRFRDAVRVGEAALPYAKEDALGALRDSLGYPRAMLKSKANSNLSVQQ